MEVAHRAKTKDGKYGVINKTGRILKKSKAELMCTGKSLPVVNDKTTIDVCQKKQVSRIGKLRKKFIAELKCTGKSLPVINDKTTINVCQKKQDSGLGRLLKKSKAELKCTTKSSPVIHDKTTIVVCGLGSLLKKSKAELKCTGNSSPVINEKTTIAVCQKKQDSRIGTKRKAEGVLQSQNVKRSKIDDCQGVLSKLMRHQYSCPFRNPVDPSAAGDYFQVIKHPMDFGTIKRKLQQNAYTDLDEFEIDVRLIFTNAMMYHPCNNWIHLYASKLSRLFDIIWTPLKAQVIEEPTIKEYPGLRNNDVQADKGMDPIANLSPSEALRATKLRARFAETILRAQTNINVQSESATELMTSEKDKQRLKQDHDEAIANIEAAVKSAKLACQLELNKKRQVEREAARTAIQKMGQTVEIDNDNWRVMNDIKALIGSAVVCRDENRKSKSALEQLGLYLKPEYKMEDDDDDRFLQNMELEEGEILD